jgi:alkylation response protein AidB-like acyl-CoA dehydrogenase
MDLDLTDDQELFRSTTRKFLEAELPTARVRQLTEDAVGVDAALWRQGAELGWFSMLVPEEHGGGTISGAGVKDTAIVAEELGWSLFPGPVVVTNVVASALARSGPVAPCERHLPGLVEGSKIATWAFAEGGDHWDARGVELEARPAAGGYRLTGTKSPVEWATAADVMLVTARTAGGLAQFLVPRGAGGVSVTPLRSLDLTRRFAEVRFDDVEVTEDELVGSLDGADREVTHQLQLALALHCAETVGALDRLFNMTLQYMNDRFAFGRPLGSFQALKHRMADMLLWLESSKAAAVAACEAVQFGVDAPEVVAIAKAYIGDRGTAIARDCLQLHGGIGFTWEHDLHLFLRKIESNAALYGTPREHHDVLEELIGV